MRETVFKYKGDPKTHVPFIIVIVVIVVVGSNSCVCRTTRVPRCSVRRKVFWGLVSLRELMRHTSALQYPLVLPIMLIFLHDD